MKTALATFAMTMMMLFVSNAHAANQLHGSIQCFQGEIIVGGEQVIDQCQNIANVINGASSGEVSLQAACEEEVPRDQQIPTTDVDGCPMDNPNIRGAKLKVTVIPLQ